MAGVASCPVRAERRSCPSAERQVRVSPKTAACRTLAINGCAERLSPPKHNNLYGIRAGPGAPQPFLTFTAAAGGVLILCA
jgi:hypothetical protein